MGTGVSHKRIGTGNFRFQFRLPSSANHLTELRSLSRFAQSANTICQLLKSEKVNFFIFSSLPSRAGSLKSSTVYKTLTLFFLRKEVIQPHLPIRLPCYDFTPVIRPAFDSSLLSLGSLASGISDSHGVTGGVYKTRERIHRGILIRDY